MNNDTFLYILLGFFILSGIIHLCYYLFVFSRFASYKPKDAGGKKQPVSVIICAKNELKNLEQFLAWVLEQDYPDFEVILVNDCSWDGTASYLEELAPNYPQLKIVTIPEQDKYRHGKKFALTLGIKAAKNDVLLMTDADCMPVSKDWISLMVRNFNIPPTPFKGGIEIVLGYGAYQKEKSFLNRLIRFDTFTIALQYFGFALNGHAYMGVGRNLAYRRSLFFRNKGFAKHNHLFSGDDDLFVNETATSENTAIEIHPDSFTVSIPKQTMNEWMTQKSRHGTTSNYYKTSHKTHLAALHLSNIFFFLLLITLLILRCQWKLVLVIYLLKLLSEWVVSLLAAKKLNERDLMWFYPLYEIVLVFLQPVFYISSLLTKQKAWK